LKNLISSIFSHELKNSLTSVKFGIEMLDKYEMSNEEKKDLVKNSLQTIASTISIVEEYLDFVKFQFDNNLKISEVNIDNLLNNIKNELEYYAKEKLVNVYIKKSTIKIHINKFWLKRAIHNIVFNAIKYNNNGGSVNIYVETTLRGVYISISDTGKGIKKEKLKNIFKLFERVDEKSRGFGVGLALSKSVIDSFGGYIKVHSNESIGSEFILYIPKEPKKTTIKKVAFSMASVSAVLFFVISYFPIYSQTYNKISNTEYEIYSFEDGSVAKFKKDSDYEISSYKNLYNTKYSLHSSINYGEMSLKAVKSKAYIEVEDIEFNNLGTDFAIFKDENTKLAVFEGAVKSGELVSNKGDGAIFTKDGYKQFKLLPAVENIKFHNSYLSFKNNPDSVKYQIIISSNENFSNIVDSFYTTKNHIKLNLKYDTQYFIKIFSFDKNYLPSNPKVLKYINLVHYNKAINLIKNNDLNEAFLELKSSISTIKNQSSLPYFEISKLYFYKKEYNESIKYILKAIEVEKKLDYYLLLFNNYYKIDKINDIENKINYVFNKNSKNIDMLYFKSLLLYKNKNYKKASEYLFKVLQSKPYYKGANNLMGEILEKQGNKKLSIYYKNLEK
jgi:two-component sensor histidine kinase